MEFITNRIQIHSSVFVSCPGQIRCDFVVSVYNCGGGRNIEHSRSIVRDDVENIEDVVHDFEESVAKGHDDEIQEEDLVGLLVESNFSKEESASSVDEVEYIGGESSGPSNHHFWDF
ncbi:PREDICTED: uncharacterized protein LOC104700110 isoform X2 [Camelina sativa]|uniref:Uncharacterized protein LOC104700110 isoform X2 n=1 Tax=Camelina sativa TaxID=90675 RepID=A0ABM0SNM5_CAMSA|nr:PREDICTED: uncharacterized protein LOC104700110 isoform X2 [Camelina sativa]